MNKQHYKTVLEQTVAPPPDPEARLRARRAAVEEFVRIQARSQAHSKDGGATATALPARARSWMVQTRAFALAASIGVAVIGIAVTLPMLRENPDLLSPPAAHELTTSTEKPAEAPPPTVSAAPVEPATAEPAAESPRVLPRSEPFSPPPGQLPLAPPAAEVRAAESAATAVEGPREELASAIDVPAKPTGIADSITSEDIDKFPDTSTAESLQRVPGIIANPSTLDPKTTQAARESESSEVVVTGARAARNARLRAAPQKRVSAPPPAITMNHGLVEPPAAEEYTGGDRFRSFEANAVKQVSAEPVSTFSADVDTASYGFVRKQLTQGLLPQKDAVRVEEMINYFDYAWPAADSRETPFRPTVVVSDSPWGKGRKLIHIGIKGYELPARQRPDANLVLLIDVSGSMNAPDKLPLVKDAMRLLVDNLEDDDTVAIVVYAGAAGQVLPPTPVKEKDKILAALATLTPGGSTAGAEGIRLAYELAEKSFRKEGVNRILLATDGDFNVGIHNTRELEGFVERKRAKGIFLSVLGFGQGNYRDELAQALAQNGNGVAVYIDTLNEAHKVLVQEAGAALFTIAKDVKLQVEFNPATVAEYRLVGYETRALKREDFNNDAVDAGDVGAGHAVTAIYEITPFALNARMLDESRYAPKEGTPAGKGTAGEYGYLKIRYKLPDSQKSRLIEQPINIDAGRVPEAIARDIEFSTAVAGFGQLLRGGAYTGALGYDDVARQALAARGEDPFGYRNEFVQLVRKAQTAKGL